MPITLRDLQSALPDSPLYGGGSWRWSPEPLALTRKEARFIEALGHPLERFQSACDEIYRRSAAGRLPDWVARTLDIGKPEWLVDWQRLNATKIHQPRIIRPDLMLQRDGFGLTELDSVPGGIGITAWLSETYSAAGYDVLGGSHGMVHGFRGIMPDGGKVLISDEASDYRPEMNWLCTQLGPAWQVERAEDYTPDDSPLYRFFELFDWESIPAAREIADRSARGESHITPGFKAHLEEKLWLALFWTPGLQGVWEQSLRQNHLTRLREIIPHAWIPDPTPLPPQAALPYLNLHSWEEIAKLSQSKRHLVLKISGFHETAWGSRGVHIGHDMASADWQGQIQRAVAEAGSQPSVLQDFREGRIIEHPVYRDDGSVETMRGRVRLCPYYFTNTSGHTSLGGCLATIVPADKKKVHGMSDAILTPCIVGSDQETR